MPEKDLVPHNVEQDTVQIYLSEERGLIPSFKWSPLGGSTHVSLSLFLSLSLSLSVSLLLPILMIEPHSGQIVMCL